MRIHSRELAKTKSPHLTLDAMAVPKCSENMLYIRRIYEERKDSAAAAARKPERNL